MELMDGVILIEECTETSDMGYIMMIVSLVITTVLSLGAYKISEVFEEKCKDTAKRFVAALALTFLISGIFITLKVVPDLDTFQEPNGKYKVTVSSNVDMNEFQNRYKIIDFENDIYTV